MCPTSSYLLPAVWCLLLKVHISTPPLKSTALRCQVEASWSFHWRPLWILDTWSKDELLWSCSPRSGSFVSTLCLGGDPSLFMSKDHWIIEQVRGWSSPTSTCCVSPPSVGQSKGSQAPCRLCLISTAWENCAAPAAVRMSTASRWSARAQWSACPSLRMGMWLRSCTSFPNCTWSSCPTSTQTTIIWVRGWTTSPQVGQERRCIWIYVKPLFTHFSLQPVVWFVSVTSVSCCGESRSNTNWPLKWKHTLSICF